MIPTHRDILLQPSDSVFLELDDKANLKAHREPDNRVFVDSLFGIVLANADTLIRVGEKNIDKIPNSIAKIDADFASFKGRIESRLSAGTLNRAYGSYLLKLNELLKFSRLLKIIPTDATAYSVLQKSLDKQYAYVLQNLHMLKEIDSYYNNLIIYYSIQLQAFDRRKTTSDFGVYVMDADTCFLRSNFVRRYLLAYLDQDGEIKNFYQFEGIVKRLKASGIADTRFDSLVEVKKKSFELVTLKGKGIVGVSNDSSDYYTLIQSLRGKAVFVDFWASWCGPCRAQMPYLHKVKTELRGNGISFVSISIDNDDQVQEWIAASKDEKVFNKKYNYRLQKGNRNELLKILDIHSVPRYMLYDRNGALVDNNFLTPNDKRFKHELLAHLK